MERIESGIPSIIRAPLNPRGELVIDARFHCNDLFRYAL